MSAPTRRRAGAGRIFAFALTIALAVTVLLVQLVRTPALDAKDRATPIEVEVAALGQGLFTSPELGPALQQIAAVTAEAEPTAVSQTVQIKRGGTLMNTLVAAGAERVQAHEAITALKEVFDPRRLRAGQEIVITMLPGQGDAAGRLLSVAIPVTPEREVAAVRDPEGQFVPGDVTHALDREPVRAVATINDSLFLAAERAGVPARIIMDAIRIFSWDVDFQREIRPGDGFELLFERLHNEDGEAVMVGEIIFASLTLSGKTLRLYRHQLEDGTTDYFDEKGHSVRKALLRTPVDGAQLSSGFGRRHHPILGYTKMHQGLDFAAPSGTPIMAAGDGVIETAGRNGAYGKYICIRHNSTYKTAYAHMKSYARGIRSGKRVVQGQIIGFVGMTGRSTGPHLHYEVLTEGRQTNPLKIKLPTGQILENKALARFVERRLEIDALLETTPAETETAAN
jgi:murein DD-endopeptidase MepM/ murein hydrolase activator NlpD